MNVGSIQTRALELGASPHDRLKNEIPDIEWSALIKLNEKINAIGVDVS